MVENETKELESEWEGGEIMNNNTPWLTRAVDGNGSTSRSAEKMARGMPSAGTTPADFISHL